MAITEATASMIGAGIAAGASTAGTMVNSSGKKRSQQRANRYQRELMDYQNKIALENWNKENAYNSPAAQMQRYIDAGLNPNLIYGQANQAGSIGEYQPSSVMPVDSAGNIIGAGLMDASHSFTDAFEKIAAAKMQGYDLQIKEQETGFILASMVDQYSSIIADYQAKVQEAASRSGQAQRDIAYNVAEANAYQGKDLEDALKAELKAMALENYLVLEYGDANAKAELTSKQSAATIDKIEADFQKAFNDLDFKELMTGKGLQLLFKVILGALGAANNGANFYSNIQKIRSVKDTVKGKKDK